MILQRFFRSFRAWQWGGWPDRAYQSEDYQQRLTAVQSHLSECLNAAPTGPVRTLSICAGDGRDVIGVVPSHRRCHDVSACLVEQSARSVRLGQECARSAGLSDAIRFLQADATVFATYQAIAPADIVLLCGVWGHVPTSERANVVRGLSCLCKPQGVVIWTRGISKGMNRLSEIETQFNGPTWQRDRLSFTPDQKWAITTHRYCGPSRPIPVDDRFFRFDSGIGNREEQAARDQQAAMQPL